MTTLITGLGLVGIGFAQNAVARGEDLVFYDAEPRQSFLDELLPGTEVTVLKRDLRDLPALVEAMTAHGIGTVVHTAGLIGNRVADPVYTGIQINVQGTINVAEASRLTGVKRLIHISTFGVYDRTNEGTEPLSVDAPQWGINPYSATKVANELLMRSYQNHYRSFDLAVVRPANVYGPGHFWGGSGGGAMVQSLVAAGIAGTTARIPSASTRAFEYVYYKDLGRLIDRAATVDLPDYCAFNAGNGIITQFSELVEAVRSALPGLQVEILEGATPDSMTAPMDLSASNGMLNWVPEFTLEEGFTDYARSLRARG